MEWMIRVGAGAGAGVAGAGAGELAGGAAWAASNGAAEPPSTVPIKSSAPQRRLELVVLEITLPRLRCVGARGALRR